MKFFAQRCGVVLSCCFVLAVSGLCAAERSPEDAAAYFEQHIRPLLVAKCLKCHGEQKQEGKLRLDSRAAMLAGGENGPALVPGKTAASRLIEAVRYETLEMPPTGKLSDQDIGHLEAWVAAGAVWPEHSRQIRASAHGITSNDREWWAVQRIHNPPVPSLDSDSWSKTPIDRFVYQKLVQRDLQPAPRADRASLVRRLYFDLIGMPPTPAETMAFVRDESADAWERLIDKLLADKRYGEHWSRFWLDLVRYSESDGWNLDAYRPNIWRYRDYVVNAFNEDKPYPVFVREQLAGDEIPDRGPDQLAAAGFLRLGIYEYNQRDARSHWNDIMNEITDVTSDVFLGVGMACARCHDHKFDPVLQLDYYKLRAFFEPLVWRDDLPAARNSEFVEYQAKMTYWEYATQDIRGRIDEFLKPFADRKWRSTVDKFPLDIQACFHKPIAQRSSWEDQMAYLVSRQYMEEGGGPVSGMKKEDKQQYDALQKELAAFDFMLPQPLPKVTTVTDFNGAISPTSIPDDPENSAVEPGILTILQDQPATSQLPFSFPKVPNSTGRRTALAEWIGRGDNPLSMRVIVNRIWQQHFGEGIVSTPNDFGKTGQNPTHPELLDWLTVQFVESGSSAKSLHKLILTSAVWQQSSHHPQAERQQALDPSDNLLWRARIRRLSAEQLRDAMFMVSGELAAPIGGPSVDASVSRRTLYVKSFRNTPNDFLDAFDAANGLKSTPQRNSTTTPLQSLLMFNSKVTQARAERLAERLEQLGLGSPENTVTYAIQMTWGREPTSDELGSALRFVLAAGNPGSLAIEHDRLVDFCHVLFNSSEFLYLD